MTEREKIIDNSLSAFVFDPWPSREETPDAASGPEGEERECGGEEDAADRLKPSPAPARLAWGMAFGVRRVVFAATLFAVLSLLMTMMMNQEMTLVEAVILYRDRFASFIDAIG